MIKQLSVLQQIEVVRLLCYVRFEVDIPINLDNGSKDFTGLGSTKSLVVQTKMNLSLIIDCLKFFFFVTVMKQAYLRVRCCILTEFMWDFRAN